MAAYQEAVQLNDTLDAGCAQDTDDNASAGVGRAGRLMRPLLALVSAGTFLVSGCGDSDPSTEVVAAAASTATPTTEATPATSQSPTTTEAPTTTARNTTTTEAQTSTTEDTAAETPTTATERGEIILNGTVTFDHLGNLEPGANPIYTTQPNGDPLEVPRLDPSTPESLTYTALNLLACHMTMGDPACKDALTVTRQEGGQLDYLHDEMQAILEPGNNAQVAIFSNPENPAVFTVVTQNRNIVLELTGGELYIERLVDNYGENDWQGEWTRQYASMGSRDLVATTLRMDFRQQDQDGWDESNEPVMTHFDYFFDGVR